MGKDINEGGTRHPATPGQSHSLLIYQTKWEEKCIWQWQAISFVQQTQLVWAASSRDPHTLYTPLCISVRSWSCTHPDASVHGAWWAQHTWDPSRVGHRVGGLWHPLPTLRVTHRDGGGVGGQPGGWLPAGPCLALAPLFFVLAWRIMSCNYQRWLSDERFCSSTFSQDPGRDSLFYARRVTREGSWGTSPK